jgi:hypothetical protein
MNKIRPIIMVQVRAYMPTAKVMALKESRLLNRENLERVTHHNLAIEVSLYHSTFSTYVYEKAEILHTFSFRRMDREYSNSNINVI